MQFVGFSVYNTIDESGMCGGDEFARDFFVEYYLIVGEKRFKNVETNIIISDTLENGKMHDIFLDNVISVKAR